MYVVKIKDKSKKIKDGMKIWEFENVRI